jgi:hypothetical protein
MNERMESRALWLMIGVIIGMVLAYRSRGKLVALRLHPETVRAIS